MTHLPVANLLGALVEDNLIARFAPMATCGQQVGERLDQSNGPERWTRMDSIHVHTYVYIYIPFVDAFEHLSLYGKDSLHTELVDICSCGS